MRFLKKKQVPPASGPILVFDMGGTKLRAAVCADGITLEEPVAVHNSQDFAEAMQLARDAGFSALKGRHPRLVVAGVAGILATGGTRLFSSPHLPKWAGEPLIERMRDSFLCPVRLENDAALAALGEAVYGAGKGQTIVAYLTVSTGIGGARIVKQQIVAKAVGFEPGHQIVDASRRREADGGEFEALASGSAIWARFGIAPKELTDKKRIAELTEIVSIGVSNTILHWSPDIVVMGGSIMLGQNPIPIREVEALVKARLDFLPRIPAFSLAKMGDAAGLHGALAYALRK